MQGGECVRVDVVDAGQLCVVSHCEVRVGGIGVLVRPLHEQHCVVSAVQSMDGKGATVACTHVACSVRQHMSCTAGKGARAACKPGSPTTAQLPLPVTTVEVAGLAGHVAAGTASLTAAARTNGDADVWLDVVVFEAASGSSSATCIKQTPASCRHKAGATLECCLRCSCQNLCRG